MNEFLKWRKTIIAGVTILGFAAFFTLFSGINKLKEENKYLGSLTPYSNLNEEKLVAETKPYELIKTTIPYFESISATAAVSSTVPVVEEKGETENAGAISDNEYIKAYLEDWRKMEAKLKPSEVFSLNNYADFTKKIEAIAARANAEKNSLAATAGTNAADPANGASGARNLPFVCLANPCLVSTVVVYNDNAKIDCGGYVLMPNAADTPGIIIKANNVTVANCGLERFTTAIEVEGNGAVIHNNKIKNIEKGGVVLKSGSALVFGNTFGNIQVFAVNILRSATQNTFYKNIFSGNEGGVIVASAQNNFVENNFENNSKEALVFRVAGENFAAKNSFSGNAGFGIGIDSANKNIIFDNTINGGGYGLYGSQSQGNQMIGNKIQNNSKQGIYLEDAQFNDIIGNNILSNGSEGIWIGGLSDGNKIRLNEIKGNKSVCSLSFGEINGAKPENNTVELNVIDKGECE